MAQLVEQGQLLRGYMMLRAAIDKEENKFSADLRQSLSQYLFKLESRLYAESMYAETLRDIRDDYFERLVPKYLPTVKKTASEI